MFTISVLLPFMQTGATSRRGDVFLHFSHSFAEETVYLHKRRLNEDV